MKHAASSKPFPKKPEEVAAAIKRAPERVHDTESPYDPNNRAAVEEFWTGATVRRPGQRGPGKRAKKVLLSVRYSPEVVAYFKATGESWQTRMDEALRNGWRLTRPIDSLARVALASGAPGVGLVPRRYSGV